MGVEWRWIPGSSFADTATFERNGSEAKEVRMGKFEERSTDQKEECLDFCMEESDSKRVLGSWVGTKEDANMRLRRAGGL